IMTTPFPDGRKSVRVYEGQINRNNNLLKQTASTIVDPKEPGCDQLKPRPLPLIEGMNRQYAFQLGPHDGQYVITRIDVFNARVRPIHCILFARLCEHARDMTFREMCEDGSTRFLEFKESSWQGKPAKELKIECPYVLRSGGEVTVRSSYFFSPS